MPKAVAQPAPQLVSERRRFGMHQNLLYDVILRQAGTLQKAVLEGVMNGVDAQATRIDIQLANDAVSIQDDGHGFRTRAEIEHVFEIFGAPQDATKTFSRFHMGRGQLFAFGRNTWTTNAFQMQVDVKAQGLDYVLTDLTPAVPGCRIDITLYDALLPSALDSVVRELKAWVSWVSVPVFINGVRASKTIDQADWTHTTDEFVVKIQARGMLDIFNQGVLVCSMPAHRHGTGGTIVSKVPLQVNFARNDVQSSCPVWRRILRVLQQHSEQVVVQKPRINDAERQHVVQKLQAGELRVDDIWSHKLFQNVEGKYYSFEQMLRAPPRQVSSAPRGDAVATRAHEQKLAFVFSEETLGHFDVESPAALLNKLRAMIPVAPHSRSIFVNRWLDICTAVGRDAFDAIIQDTHEEVPMTGMNALQRRNFLCIDAAMRVIAVHAEKGRRRLLAGKSDVADAWTDGAHTIWINVTQLSLVPQGYTGCIRLASLILHEYLHDSSDIETHDHDAEFYQMHHDLSMDTPVLGLGAEAMLRCLASKLRLEDKKVGKKVLLAEDVAANLDSRKAVAA